MRQKVHHLCLKLKHSFNAHHKRIYIEDNPVFRSIATILMEKGFLHNVLPGDHRAPFVDLLQYQNEREILSPSQDQNRKIYKAFYEKMKSLHSLLGSAGEEEQAVKKLQIKTFSDKKSLDYLLSDAFLLEKTEKLPPLSLLHVPKPPFTVQDLEILTNIKDKRLWLDLCYDEQQTPSLTDMFLVSKGSRKVFTTPKEMEEIASGKKFNYWKSSEIGSLTLIKTSDGQLLPVEEAINQQKGGEVLLVAK